MSQLAPALADYRQEIPSKDRSGQFFVFYPADHIPGDLKAHNPDWRFGGRIKSNSMTLSYRNGFVRKCEITLLRTHMQSLSMGLVLPSDRKHVIKAYNSIENGQVTQIGINKQGEYDGLARLPVYPIDEVDVLTGQVDGMIQISCRDSQQAYEAQFFLFPNWDDIVNGEAQLPFLVSDIRKHFELRRRVAVDLKNEFYKSIADTAILACDNYLTWASGVCKKANAEYARMSAKGHAWSIGADAEMAFQQVPIQRQDMVQQNQASQIDKIGDAMSLVAEAISRTPNQQQPQPFTPMDPEAYQEFLAFQQFKREQERAKSGADNAPIKPETILDAEVEDIPVSDTVSPTEYVQCKAMVGKPDNQTQCKREATENGYCNHPAHQAKAEAETE